MKYEEKNRFRVHFLIVGNNIVLPSKFCSRFGGVVFHDVKHDGNIFTFVWDGIGEEAELVDMKKNSYVRFKWLDADDEEEFFEFSLHVEPLTEEVALIITDFVDADEEGDAIELWNKQVEMLHRTVGG